LMYSGIKETVAETAKKTDALSDGFYQQGIAVNKLNDQFSMLLQLQGFDKDKIAQWREMPKSPPIDSATGLPILNQEWLFISPNMSEGRIMKITDSVKVVSVTAWNTGEKK
ncbi:MAG: hypothetical protein Q8O19_04890, partial [Rectinemataceae bacterium]|nr:hypothetical protein [Rectinemataceae bacterium]